MHRMLQPQIVEAISSLFDSVFYASSRRDVEHKHAYNFRQATCFAHATCACCTKTTSIDR